MRIGAIGIDSSHLPEFTRRIKAMNEAGRTKCRVTQFWTDGRHDWMNTADVEKWRQDTLAMGVTESKSLKDLLDNVDGVMVLSVGGPSHLRHAAPSLVRGLPTYVDKPLTCNVAEARSLLEIARQHGARCYSASSLRFITEIEKLDRAALGRIVAIDASGPGELLDINPGVFQYGVHAIEMVDAIWGPGAKRVSAVALPDRHLIDIEYHDGRYARLRLERRGAYDFNATVHGEKGVAQFRVDFGPVYTRLVEGMTRFFEGGQAPTKLRDIVENVAIMAAANDSIAREGEWVAVPTIE